MSGRRIIEQTARYSQVTLSGVAVEKLGAWTDLVWAGVVRLSFHVFILGGESLRGCWWA
jgi:hypothetical protein